MYQNKQPKGSEDIERGWAAALVRERKDWALHWFFHAPGVVSLDRPTRGRSNRAG